MAVAVNKSLIDSQKPTIGEKKSAIDDKKSAVDRIKSAIEQQRYNATLKANIFKEYDEIEKNEYSEVSLNEVSRDWDWVRLYDIAKCDKIVKERIEGGANEKAVLRLFINCPFVCINFDFFWLNKARQLYMDF